MNIVKLAFPLGVKLMKLEMYYFKTIHKYTSLDPESRESQTILAARSLKPVLSRY